MANPNISAGAFGLTLLCPIKNASEGDQSYASIVREQLQQWPLNEASPLAKVPNTYLCRLYVLNDVFYQGYPAKEEHLQSKYLVFSSNFHGDLERYLEGMWQHAEKYVRQVWQYCVGFDGVNDGQQFVDYIKKCQIDNALFFNGSNGDSLDEQLKALYLKQEFTRFVYLNQGLSASKLQIAFAEFVNRTQPSNLVAPSWQPGRGDEAAIPISPIVDTHVVVDAV